MSDEISYNRPNQKWECGWKRKGFSCHIGPNEKGACPGKGECEPKKSGNGFECTRLPQHGGKCHNGPLPEGRCSKQFPPCSPQRSLRHKRNLLVLLALGLSAAVLFAGLGGLMKVETFFSPGGMSAQHRSFSNDCSACHGDISVDSHAKENSGNFIFNWLLRKKQIGTKEQVILGASGKCLNCHSMGDQPKNPHNLSSDTLKGMFKGGENKNIFKKTECMSCHKEHHGADFNIAKLTDNQCQSCHSKPFDSFNKGHAEFETYPFNEKVKILFDHTSHFAKHFPEKNKTGKKMECSNCHEPSPTGLKMVVKGFNTSCASCHSEQIGGEKAVNKGVVFFRLPTLDIETLKNKGIKIGSWPEDTDGEITPFKKLLLMADDDTKVALELLSENEVELDDLSESDEETLKAVQTVVWSMKKLIFGLIEEGSSGIKERLEKILETEMSREQATNLVNALPVDLIRSVNTSWFKRIASEVEKSNEGVFASTWTFSTSDDEEDEASDEDWMATGGWYKDNSDFTLRYRPKGHADSFLYEWLEHSGTHAGKHDTIAEIFSKLSHPKESPGACMKCHGIEKAQDILSANWNGKKEEKGIQDFVKFSHKPHLNLIQKDGCLTCHEINSEADFKVNSKMNIKTSDKDGSDFASNFMPIKKEVCASCHKPGKVKQDCLTCHNYHVGDFLSSSNKMKSIHTKVGEDTADTEKAVIEKEENDK